MFKKITKALPKILAFLVIVVFVVYFWFNKDDFKPLKEVNLVVVAVIVFLNISLIAMNGLFIKTILKPYKKNIPLLESFYVSLFSSVTNFFAPTGTGFGLRAVYLKKRYQLSYNDFVSTLSGNYVIVFIVNSLFALITLATLWGNDSRQYRLLVLMFTAVLVFSTLLVFIKPPTISGTKYRNKYIRKFIKLVAQMINGWRQLVQDRRLILKLTAIILVNFLISLLIVTLEMKSLDINIGVQGIILFTVLSNMSLFINITPANIGVKEAIYVFSATVIGLSVSEVLLVQLVDRGIIFITFFILWISTTRLRRKINSAISD